MVATKFKCEFEDKHFLGVNSRLSHLAIVKLGALAISDQFERLRQADSP